MKKDELREYLNRDIESLRSLNFSEPYIKSVSENTSKWASTGLLGGISDPYVGRNVATLLENQILFNKEWTPEETDDHFVSQWKRISVPVIRRVFGSFVGNQLVSVQAMKSNQENTYLIGFDGRTMSGMTESKTRALSVQWERPIWKYGEDNKVSWVEFRDQKYQMGLDAEAEATAIFAEAVSNDFTREIIRDLAMNAGKLAVYEYKDETHLLSLVEGMSSYIAAKCYTREATWLVTSPAIVKLLGEYIEPSTDQWGKIIDINAQREGVNKVGVLNKKWQLFEDSTAPSGNILLGLKDHRNHYFSGYVFAPFLPVNPTITGETDKQEQILARYGKRLTNPGFYGTIKIENLPEATPLEKPESEEAESEE
jgi:hypothetical protein